HFLETLGVIHQNLDVQHWSSLKVILPVLQRLYVISLESSKSQWILTSYEDVSTLLRDKRLGRVLENVKLNPNPAHAPFEAVQQGSLLELEPPDHTRIRIAVQDTFTPKHVRALEGKIAALCDRLADTLAKRPGREADLLKDFAEPIPVTVIAELLGVPEPDRHRLVPWSKAIIGMFEPERTPEMERVAVSAAQAFADYVRGLIEKKRIDPQDDLISRMVRLRDEEPGRLSEAEIVANAILFLNAGHEAVVNVIGNGMVALLGRPKLWRRLREHPELVETALEEAMRFDTPLQFFERVVRQEVSYRGYTWPRGTRVCLFYASANRDEAIFKDPETFDLERHPNPHLAFGLGLHYCIGAPLARLEFKHALLALTRFSSLALQDAPSYHPKNVFRYPTSLRVTF
ncbi:cytochrome P450, partial [Coleofasciculus sp. H7-2]|uniref:cytochrome P450 n=1 Tax=Coleofasciculus sp. H7-2 TaxID=3351545 RepID=UPI00366F3134